MTLLVVISVTAGMLAGRYLVDPAWLAPVEGWITMALVLLLATVGFELGSDRRAFIKAWQNRKRLLTLPWVVAAASLAGAGAAGFLARFSLHEALAAGAGFGWYSLSGVLVGREFGAEAGAVAFLANLMRELSVLMLAPYLARRAGGGGLVGAAGATAMDSTLPSIVKAAGGQVAVAAFVSGAALSVLAPITIWLLAAMR